MYTDAWRKTNNDPDSEANKVPAELEGRGSRKKGTSDVS